MTNASGRASIARYHARRTMDQGDRMTSPLTRDISWLNARLDEVDTPAAKRIVGRVREAASAMLGSVGPDPSLAGLSADEIHAALKSLTIRFHLRNKAEQVHIVRINRGRELVATPEQPRPESIEQAVGLMAANGVDLAALCATLERIDIRPTLTAHPTESRRRSVMLKQARIADLLGRRDQGEQTPAERARGDSAVRQTLALLLATDEVRARRLDVMDEVRNGISFLAGSIWDAVPGLYRDLGESVEAHYGESPDLPIVLRYRTWIGGDRDGNPNVTSALTRATFETMRSAAVSRHAEALERLRQELSVSDRRAPIDDALRRSIDADERDSTLDSEQRRHLTHEPFRVKISHMQRRLATREYCAAEYVEDLRVLQRALRVAGLSEGASRGPLADAMIHARTFGFHLAAMDVRQHSRVHEEAVAELFALAGVCANYESLDEEARIQALRRELSTARPLAGGNAALSPTTRELLDTLRVVSEQTAREPESVGAYIVSMAHDVSDVLEVLVLMREVGLWTIAAGVAKCPVDVVPLFETVDDLHRAAGVMRALFREPAYAAHLAARSRFQEIMLGYSDSNKDGGYWAANWRLHAAQDDLARACVEEGVTFRFFHGRGGTVARGGGRAHRAILATPAVSRNGQIRFTEQGEVISFRYAMPALAHRHLEQIVNAMLLSTGGAPPEERPAGVSADLMDALAERSRTAYRGLIDRAGFWEWFIERSPVLHIGELPIASRPVLRSGQRVHFDNLRAIPWVFAWTQMRYNAPGWFGIGSAFDELAMGDAERIEACREAYRAGGCFRAFLDNAQQEMARARLPVARWYAGDQGDEAHALLESEYQRAERVMLAITGQAALLDNNPVIQRSIHERNPDTDAINALQVELLRRWREASEADRGGLRPLILLSVNALAAAMQSTG